ncbi:MAG: glyoxalase [Pseudomonadota bacterium]
MAALLTALDHVLIHTQDFPDDLDNYTSLLGSAPAVTHTVAGERSAVFSAGNTALVLQESDSGEGLGGLCFRTADRDRLRRRLKRLGMAFAADGADDSAAAVHGAALGEGIDWLEVEASRGLRMGFVAREGVATPDGSGTSAERSGLLGLDHAVIASSSAEGTAFLLAAKLGLDLRLDLSRPDWNARLLFFRCGDLIIEVFQQLSTDESSAETSGIPADEDRYYGLSWRTASAEAAQVQLKDAGFNVSELRRGRKPGTRVFTVRDRSAGVATLMLEPNSL